MPTAASRAPRPVADLTYEEARDELVTVVSRLEAGGETLEGSLALWERGEALAARCLEWLDGARARLEATRPDAARPDGAPPAEKPGRADSATSADSADEFSGAADGLESTDDDVQGTDRELA